MKIILFEAMCSLFGVFASNACSSVRQENCMELFAPVNHIILKVGWNGQKWKKNVATFRFP